MASFKFNLKSLLSVIAVVLISRGFVNYADSLANFTLEIHKSHSDYLNPLKSHEFGFTEKDHINLAPDSTIILTWRSLIADLSSGLRLKTRLWKPRLFETTVLKQEWWNQVPAQLDWEDLKPAHIPGAKLSAIVFGEASLKDQFTLPSFNWRSFEEAFLLTFLSEQMRTRLQPKLNLELEKELAQWKEHVYQVAALANQWLIQKTSTAQVQQGLVKAQAFCRSN